MRSERRGIALVLNNYYFPHKAKDTLRKGSQNDVVYLEQFLSSCKFDVTIKDNISSKVHFFWLLLSLYYISI